MKNDYENDGLSLEDGTINLFKRMLILSSIFSSFISGIIGYFFLLSGMFLTIYNFLFDGSFSFVYTGVFAIGIFLSLFSYYSSGIYERNQEYVGKLSFFLNFFSNLIKYLFLIFLFCVYFVSYIGVIQNKNVRVEESSFNGLFGGTEIKIVQKGKYFKRTKNENRESFEFNLYKEYLTKIVEKFKI